jgi:hypothetical protein
MSRTRRVQLALFILILASVCSVSQTSAPSPKAAVRKSIPHGTLQYINSQFGFRFTLPGDWKGYSIVMTAWGGSGDTASVKGPILSIRNPHWTEKTLWQDIPIMSFTHRQWSLVHDGRLTVRAGPMTPQNSGEIDDTFSRSLRDTTSTRTSVTRKSFRL